MLSSEIFGHRRALSQAAAVPALLNVRYGANACAVQSVGIHSCVDALRHLLLHRLPECSELELPSGMTTSHPPSRVIIQQETVGDRKYNSVVATTGLC